MNWGHRVKELFTSNWREKIISVVLAFLFWFMIKAQDVRPPPAYLPPQTMKVQQTIPAPSQLAPTLQPSAEVPSKLTPVVPPPDTGAEPALPAEGIGKATGL